MTTDSLKKHTKQKEGGLHGTQHLWVPLEEASPQEQEDPMAPHTHTNGEGPHKAFQQPAKAHSQGSKTCFEHL